MSENTTLPVSEITRLYIAKRYSDDDVRAVRRALQIPALPESWKRYFRDRLEAMKVVEGGTNRVGRTFLSDLR